MKKVLLTVAVGMMATMSMAQKFKDETGSLSVLAKAKTVNLEYNYSNLKLLKENVTEKEYVDKRKDELNKKSNGEGDIWLKKWESAKSSIWQLKFEELLVKTVTKDANISFKENAKDAKYTLLVDVVWIYPGWDAAVMKQPAKVTTELKIVETANPKKVLYSVLADDAPGDQWGNNFSNESRIGEGFAKTAKSFGKRIVKELK